MLLFDEMPVPPAVASTYARVTMILGSGRRRLAHRLLPNFAAI